MSVWKLVKGIRFRQLLVLSGFLFKHPILLVATLKATSLTMKIVQEKFPNIHGKDNKANAYRHALWNALIAFHCLKKEQDIKLVISWTKEITDWHEDFSPNEPLARAMDLHNNYIGRLVFQQQHWNTIKDIELEIEKLVASAIKVHGVKEIDKQLRALVYIQND